MSLPALLGPRLGRATQPRDDGWASGSWGRNERQTRIHECEKDQMQPTTRRSESSPRGSCCCAALVAVSARLEPTSARCGLGYAWGRWSGCRQKWGVFSAVVLGLAGLRGAPLVLAAVDLPRFVARSWQTDNGLPQSTATAVLQAQDGYLWVGTYNGLVRYDGVRFVVFDNNNTPELQDKGITSLFQAADGTLWIGHSSGGLTRYKNGQFKRVNVALSWGEGAIKAIATDGMEDVWLLSDTGLVARLRDGLILTPPTGPLSGLAEMVRSEHGDIWVSRDGCLSQLQGSRLVVLQAGDTNSFVQGVGVSRDGGLWVVSGGRLRHWQGGNWSGDLGPTPSDLVPVVKLLETQDGWLAAATSDHGFYLSQPRAGGISIQFARVSGFPSDWVTSLCEDREGDLWVGTGGAGLQVVRPAKVQTVAPPDQWQGRPVLSVSVSGRDETLFIGSEGAGVYRLDHGTWRNFGLRDGLEALYIWSAVEDGEGDLWVASWGGGLYQCREGHFAPAPGLERFTIPTTALLCSRQGGLWIGTLAGLLRYQNGKTAWYGQEGRPGDRSVHTMIRGSGRDSLVRHFRRRVGLSDEWRGEVAPTAGRTGERLCHVPAPG